MEKVKTEADPLVLDQYRRLLKKEVSLFNRPKVAAYLLMLAEQGKRSGLSDLAVPKQRRDAEKNGKRERERERSAERYPLADEDSKWLFFGVGRARRASPRDILGFIHSKVELQKEDIGAIRIMENYSFVQVRETEAEKVIEAINGQPYKGRPLAVNYAKSRKDGEDSPVEKNDCETEI